MSSLSVPCSPGAEHLEGFGTHQTVVLPHTTASTEGGRRLVWAGVSVNFVSEPTKGSLLGKALITKQPCKSKLDMHAQGLKHFTVFRSLYLEMNLLGDAAVPTPECPDILEVDERTGTA